MNAMIIPLPSENVEAWKTWIRECYGPRREEFDDFNERMELTLHRAWLTQGPQGHQVIVVLDGPGANDYVRRMGTSQEAFDQWFRKRASELHGVDFSKVSAAPSAELFMDWRAPKYAETRE